MHATARSRSRIVSKRQRHRAVEHLRVDALAIHVLDADAVEDGADGGLGMDRGERALPRTLGLRKDALEIVRPGPRVEVTDHQPLLPVPVPP